MPAAGVVWNPNYWTAREFPSFLQVGYPFTPWTAAFQAPPSMGFSRQEYWSGVPSPSPKSQLLRRYLESPESAQIPLKIPL